MGRLGQLREDILPENETYEQREDVCLCASFVYVLSQGDASW